MILGPLEDTCGALPIRANVCLQRSLTGEALPVNSQSMQDITDYCGLLGTGLQPRYASHQVSGQQSSGLTESALALIRQIDPKIYQDHCTSCHIRY